MVMLLLYATSSLYFFVGWNGNTVNIIGVVVVEHEEILVAAAGWNGELSSSIGVYLTGDRDTCWGDVPAPWKRAG